jgi:hypothetical protein
MAYVKVRVVAGSVILSSNLGGPTIKKYHFSNMLIKKRVD